jgi:acetyl-CoA acyltransferase
MSRDVFIIDAVRTPIAKAGTPKRRGTLEMVRPDDLIAITIESILSRTPTLPPPAIDDLVIGCAFPEAEQGFNIGRIAALRAGLPFTTTGMTVNRFCASGLQAIVTAHDAIAMGMTAENVAHQFSVSRADQDAFAYESHRRAVTAQEAGHFAGEITPISVARVLYEGGKAVEKTISLTVDEGPRPDTSAESLARLKPAFTATGSVTAGNASQISDGAAAVLLASAEAVATHRLTPRARIASFATTGNNPAIMGVAPIDAIPKALARAGLTRDALDIIEINEAFASQCLAIIRTLELDPTKVNVNGGAIALGHPLGCTGARIFATALSEATRRGSTYFGVGMCVGGGQGAFAVAERLA